MAVVVKIIRFSDGRTCFQIIADDVEVDAFRRCARNVRRLTRATERVLDVRTSLWARATRPVTQIAGPILIEINDVTGSFIDREIARAVGSDISNASR